MTIEKKIMTTKTSACEMNTNDNRVEIKDDYEHENLDIEYVVENVLFEPAESINQQTTIDYQNLAEQFNSVLLNACSCSAKCDSHDSCAHGGNYISSPTTTELILNPNRHSKDLIYECSAVCKCDPASCQNRLVQYGPRLSLEIITSKVLHKQYALRTNVPICRGAFICEYAGEILTPAEAKRRMDIEPATDYNTITGKSNKMNYVLCLNEYPIAGGSTSPISSQKTFIDPRLKGNIGRYLNHSCQPNCEIFSVRVDCPIPKIAIFAKRDIATGEELCFHYGEGVAASAPNAHAVPASNTSTRCLCGSSNCEKFLPNFEF